jgi:DNA-binding beta-propeller fold protein YncE
MVPKGAPGAKRREGSVVGELSQVVGIGDADPAEAPALGGDRAMRVRVETIAGDGIAGFADGHGAEARFNYPWGLACDAAGNLYVADTSNHRIRRVTPDGTVTTFAGVGTGGWLDGPAELARFDDPRDVAVDAAGHVYVADTDNNRIRKITPEGVVSTFSGEGTRSFADGARAVARFGYPNGVAVDAAGHVFVADAENRRLRKVSPGGTATTLAGDGASGFADGLGTEARLSSPRSVVVDALGHLCFVEVGNSRVRRLSPDGRLVTIAGDGRGKHADGPGPAASFRDPCALAIDAHGVLYVADSGNHCIRRLDLDGLVTTIAGDPRSLADFADGDGPAARFSEPRGIAVGPRGVLYVADTLNHCIRRITFL